MMLRPNVPTTAALQFGSLHQELIQSLGYGDLEEELTECAHLADQAFARNFSAAAGPHSGPWAPRKQGGSGLGDAQGRTIGTHPLEILTAEMFEAVTSPFGRGHIEDVGYRGAEIGVDPSSPAGAYVFAQNYGNPLKGLPQREFVDIGDEDADRMADIIADGMERLLGG